MWTEKEVYTKSTLRQIEKDTKEVCIDQVLMGKTHDNIDFCL